jgi:hypothetical protein
MSNGWFETVAEAERRAKKRLPKSIGHAAGTSLVLAEVCRYRLGLAAQQMCRRCGGPRTAQGSTAGDRARF